ncbi:uncharacterized protein LOC143602120 [Bidens hawaiensis]|uniref:uncharacterized protein LOC143602120 n=1 Tax=Bidens hawaiensis TaxID=980011 RepID=UPI0040492F77
MTSSKYRVEQLETTRSTTLHVNPTFPDLKEKVAILTALPLLQTNVTIPQMLTSNPVNKYSNFKCIARIKDFEAYRTWYTVKCSKCGRKLDEEEDGYACIDHENIDPKFSYCVNASIIDDTTTTKVVFFNEAMTDMLKISCKKMVIEGANKDTFVIPHELATHIGKLKLFDLTMKKDRGIIVNKATDIAAEQHLNTHGPTQKPLTITPITPDPKNVSLKRSRPDTLGASNENSEPKHQKTTN